MKGARENPHDLNPSLWDVGSISILVDPEANHVISGMPLKAISLTDFMQQDGQLRSILACLQKTGYSDTTPATVAATAR